MSSDLLPNNKNIFIYFIMPKIKRLQTFLGETLKPMYKNMKKMNIVISPHDQLGNKVARHFYDYFKNVPQKLKPEGYSFQSSLDETSLNSFMEVEYRNGWINKYVLSDHSVEGFRQYLLDKHEMIDIDIQQKDLEWDYPDTAKIVTSRK